MIFGLTGSGCVSKMRKALKITVNGRVQGVGFRPFIFQLAEKLKINGTVQNNMDGVKIFAEGEEENLHNFVFLIKNQPPRLARVDNLITEVEEYLGYTDFTIIPSERSGKSALVIPVDSAVCQECLDEMNDPGNFRYQYPFINCTQCGPRYTIIAELPYDRPYTSMEQFNMCEKCAAEYQDPSNRRHHAQPIACPECGPTVELFAISGNKIAEKNLALIKLSKLLKEGAIVAIKGLGGYHLACDALNQKAIQRLRDRKNRPKRPFAVMASTLALAKEYCHLSPTEATVLTSTEAPIVVLEQKIGRDLPHNLAPGLQTLGVMLPYTPLHHLIFAESKLNMLVMTSANPSGMPILYQEESAFTYLKEIADFVLTTDRPILHALDDSVVQIIEEQLYFLRRSRGYVPDPLTTSQPVHDIVALGGQQKNTFAIGRNQQVFLGPHIGDLGNIEIIDFFQRELQHLQKWMGTNNHLLAVDKHPDYSTSKLAKQYGGRIVEVQHHHAHLVSCMEDNQINEPCLGIILDGTGYGDDGKIWGFEFLYGDAQSFKRLGHLKYSPLPGGEKAVKEPWRNAVGMLISTFSDGEELAEKLYPDKKYEISIIANMVKKNVNSPLAGTCGRLFDAVSSIIGLCHFSTYDGEAAILLSERMPKIETISERYSYAIVTHSGDTFWEIDFSEMLWQIAHERINNHPLEMIVQKFHHTVVAAIEEMVDKIYSVLPLLNKNIVLSGGSFHNPFLLKALKNRLEGKDFKVFTHKQVPCSDGGLALGQLIVAAAVK